MTAVETASGRWAPRRRATRWASRARACTGAASHPVRRPRGQHHHGPSIRPSGTSCSRRSTASGFLIRPRQRSTRPCSTKGPISARRGRCIGCWTPPARSRSGAIRSGAPGTPRRSCSRRSRTRFGAGTSRSSSARSSGRTFLCTSSSTSSVGTSSAGYCAPRERRARRAAHRRDVRPSAFARPTHAACRPGRRDAHGSRRPAVAISGWSRRRGRPVHVQRRPIFRIPVQNAEIMSQISRRFESMERTRSARCSFPRKPGRHPSGLGFLTPAVVHLGRPGTVRAHRDWVFAAAYAAHPERFMKAVRTPPISRSRLDQPAREKHAGQDRPGPRSPDPTARRMAG